jgi:hypothetical protein
MLTDDIRWTVFGHYQLPGKAAYAEHITEPGLSRPPSLEVFVMRDGLICERRAFVIPVAPSVLGASIHQ